MRKIYGIIMILTGVIFALIFAIEGVKVYEEDPSRFFTAQYERGEEISLIKSVGGRTLEEAFYQSYGRYLSYQGEITKSVFNIVKRIAMALIYTGVAFSIAFIALGIWLLLPERFMSDKIQADTDS